MRNGIDTAISLTSSLGGISTEGVTSAVTSAVNDFARDKLWIRDNLVANGFHTFWNVMLPLHNTVGMWGNRRDLLAHKNLLHHMASTLDQAGRRNEQAVLQLGSAASVEKFGLVATAIAAVPLATTALATSLPMESQIGVCAAITLAAV